MVNRVAGPQTAAVAKFLLNVSLGLGLLIDPVYSSPLDSSWIWIDLPSRWGIVIIFAHLEIIYEFINKNSIFENKQK